MKALIIFLPPIVWIVASFFLMSRGGFAGQSAAPSEPKAQTAKRPGEYKSDLVPWSIVQSKDGRFNYVTDGGYIFPLHDFPTREEACGYRDRRKAMFDAQKREERVWTPEERRRMDEVQARHWNYLPEADCEGNKKGTQ